MTGSILASRPTLIWLLLVAASLLSFESMLLGGGGARLARSAILIIAFAKVLLVGREFMELRHAPPLLRNLFQAWAIIVCGVLLVLFR